MSLTNKEQSLNDLISRFPARYRVKDTTYLRAILDALAEGDSFVRTQIEAVRDNLLVITASGKHLDRIASQYGVERDQSAGIQDPDFIKLVPVLGLSPKQITHTLLQIIDTIYGPYSSRANITCSKAAPYNIADGTKIKVLVDGEILEVTFNESDASDLTQVSAKEVSMAISNKSGGKIVGSVVSNIRTGEKFVNLRTSTMGSQGFIQVLGGQIQSALKFPEVRETIQGISSWNISHVNGGSEMTYTVLGGVNPLFKDKGVRAGDFVIIREDSGFNSKNTGTFKVTAVGDNYFRCLNPEGLEESKPNTNVDDVTFFKPNMGNILLASRPACVLETGALEVTVLLPVTSPIVKKTLKGSHHLHGMSSLVLDTTSDSIRVATIDQYQDQGSVSPLGARLYNQATCLNVSEDSITLINAENFPESGAVYSASQQAYYYYSGKTGETLTGVLPPPPSELAGSTLKYSKRYLYTGKSGDFLTGVYPDPSELKGLEVVQTGATSNPEYVGSFLYDPDAGYVASSVVADVNENISQGSSKTVLKVDDCSEFPESGFFVIEHATDELEGPIRYLAKVGSEALIIDSGYVFSQDHLKGVPIRLVRQIGSYTPRITGEDHGLYLTSTSPAQDLLVKYLTDILAAGVTLRLKVSIPDQKWPLATQLYSDGVS